MNLICKTSDLIANGTKTYDIKLKTGTLSLVITKTGDNVFAYENKCPHLWVSLNSAAKELNSSCKQYIQCSSHFAQFKKETGYCIYGPCKGLSLVKLDIRIENGNIYYIDNQ